MMDKEQKTVYILLTDTGTLLYTKIIKFYKCTLQSCFHRF